jgi:pimeloyl-ACP methyl ester carboxylesterase
MSTVRVGEITVGYDDVGSGDPLVLVHGHPFDRSMWRPQLRYLADQGSRVIAPDLRGYGESTVIPDITLLETFARDLAALLDRLGVGRVALGGLSMGGQIALEFVRLFPERVAALILADTFAPAETEAGKRARNELADRLLREGMAGYAEEVLPRMLAPGTLREQPEVAEFVLRMMRAAPAEGAAAALRGRAERLDYTELLPRITVPTLVVAGTEDEFTPVGDARVLRDGIPDARLALVEHAGHLPNLERPARFNAEVGEFLQIGAIEFGDRLASDYHR